jgi:hypothetical protein
MHFDVTYRLNGTQRTAQVEAPDAAVAVTSVANVYGVNRRSSGTRASFELLAVTPATRPPSAHTNGNVDEPRDRRI